MIAHIRTNATVGRDVVLNVKGGKSKLGQCINVRSMNHTPGARHLTPINGRHWRRRGRKQAFDLSAQCRVRARCTICHELLQPLRMQKKKRRKMMTRAPPPFEQH